MISIFNRRELIITYDIKKQNDVRTVLQDHKIEYAVKVRNSLSGSPMSAGSRAHSGNPGVDISKSYEYKIYVKKEDYQKALNLMNRSRC